MASGSFTVQVGNRSNISNEYIQVWWTATPDAANNRSLVRVYAKMYRPWYLYVDYNQRIELWINGTKFTGSRYGWRGQGWTEAYIDKSAWVYHNGDGTKSINIRLRTEVKAWLRSYVGWVDTGNRACKLDNLARKSSFLLSKTQAQLGETVNVNLARSSSSVRHTITFNVGEYTKSVLTKANDNGSTTSYPITLTASEILPYMVGRTATGKVTVTTYNGGTSLGSDSKSFGIKLRDNVDRPSVSRENIQIEAVPIEPNTSTQHYIQGKTQARITITPTVTSGEAGAIKTYNVTVGDQKFSSSSNVILTDALATSGNTAVKVSVIDGRGMSSKAPTTKNINVLPYFTPIVANFSVARCTSDGTLNTSGQCIKVTFDYRLADCSGNNSATIVLSERNSVNSNTYTTKNTWTLDAEDEASATITQVFGTYSVDNSFDFGLTITDFFGASSAAYTDIGTEELLIDMSADGVAIGKVVERQNALEVEWDSYFDGTIYGTVQANTSDIRKKLLVDGDIDALLDIWDELSVVLFKYRDGDEKILPGLVAQDVISVFNAHELDWRDYGMIYEDPQTGFYSINYEFVNQLSMLKVRKVQSELAELAKRVCVLEMQACPLEEK